MKYILNSFVVVFNLLITACAAQEALIDTDYC